MEPFVKHTGKFITFDRANIDTDAIIPARYLKRIERTGFGEFLFMDLKQKDGQPVAGFPLNEPQAEGATVLVARQNFGCGSSREHAVWAISQWGFRAVIAPRLATTPAFADIFRNNSYKNGLLPVEVSESFVNRLFATGTGQVTIDLEAKRVTAPLPEGDLTESFDLAEGSRQMLLKGLDEIGLTLEFSPAIAAYESHHPEVTPAAA
jgi:3-isopropylmalate/(R)-2-methylmalate dehydratase small subunit